MIAVEYIESIILYVNAILVDGDWKSDWLMHLPGAMRGGVETLGRLIAARSVDKWPSWPVG